jgi:hypothetical protein
MKLKVGQKVKIRSGKVLTIKELLPERLRRTANQKNYPIKLSNNVRVGFDGRYSALGLDSRHDIIEIVTSEGEEK